MVDLVHFRSPVVRRWAQVAEHRNSRRLLSSGFRFWLALAGKLRQLRMAGLPRPLFYIILITITTASACEAGKHAESEDTRAAGHRRHRRRMGGARAAFWNRRDRGGRKAPDGGVDTRRGGQCRARTGPA